MKLTNSQWQYISEAIPDNKTRADKRGRPWIENKAVVEGILWVLKSGARWRDLPKDSYPSYQTCHRRFQNWVKKGVFYQFYQLLVRLTEHLRDSGGVDFTETYIDASFVEAKKGGHVLAQLNVAKAAKSWQSRTSALYLSPYMLRVLHHMRVDSLKKRFGPDIVASYLSELWVTKLTIQMILMPSLETNMGLNLSLPISSIESRSQLKMVTLFEDIEEDGG